MAVQRLAEYGFVRVWLGNTAAIEENAMQLKQKPDWLEPERKDQHEL